MAKRFLSKIAIPLSLCMLLTGCDGLEEGVKALPDNPSGEVTHNSVDDKSGYLAEHQPATLDENFISQYIDVNSFGTESAWVHDNSSSVHSDFESSDKSISNDITENKKEYNEQKESIDTDISDLQDKNTKNYNDDVDEMNKELEEKESEYEEKVDEYTSETEED